MFKLFQNATIEIISYNTKKCHRELDSMLNQIEDAKESQSNISELINLENKINEVRAKL